MKSTAIIAALKKYEARSRNCPAPKEGHPDRNAKEHRKAGCLEIKMKGELDGS
jgi:hypothetical protein